MTKTQQDAPKTLQEAAKTRPEAIKTPQEAFKYAQECQIDAKMEPSWLQIRIPNQVLLVKA